MFVKTICASSAPPRSMVRNISSCSCFPDYLGNIHPPQMNETQEILGDDPALLILGFYDRKIYACYSYAKGTSFYVGKKS